MNRGTALPEAHHWRHITWHALPVLAGTLVIGILAGQVLQWYQDDLTRIPILLTLVPAVNGVGGNVGSLLGSRVSSGMRMGGIWSNGAQGFRRDVVAAIALAAASFTFLGLFAWYVGPALGIDAPIALLDLAIITLAAGLGLVLVMIALVIVVGMLSHRYGWDPDNVVVPVLTTAGDTLGILFLLIAGEVVIP